MSMHARRLLFHSEGLDMQVHTTARSLLPSSGSCRRLRPNKQDGYTRRTSPHYLTKSASLVHLQVSVSVSVCGLFKGLLDAEPLWHHKELLNNNEFFHLQERDLFQFIINALMKQYQSASASDWDGESCRACDDGATFSLTMMHCKSVAQKKYSPSLSSLGEYALVNLSSLLVSHVAVRYL